MAGAGFNHFNEKVAMSVLSVSNCQPRKSLSDEIDRLDGILDGLAGGLNEAVAAEVQRTVGAAVSEAVRAAVKEALTAPDSAPGAAASPPRLRLKDAQRELWASLTVRVGRGTDPGPPPEGEAVSGRGRMGRSVVVGVRLVASAGDDLSPNAPGG
jgi:hypothetical protein